MEHEYPGFDPYHGVPHMDADGLSIFRLAEHIERVVGLMSAASDDVYTKGSDEHLRDVSRAALYRLAVDLMEEVWENDREGRDAPHSLHTLVEAVQSARRDYEYQERLKDPNPLYHKE